MTDILPAVFDSPVQGILCTRHDGSIVHCNRTLARVFGYSPEELIGKSVELLLPETLRSSHARYRESYASAPVVRPMGVGVELRGRRKDGSEFPVEVSLSLARTGDESLVVAFVADITVRKDLENRLARSQKLEALGILSAGLAHDFNNLLTIILGYVDQSAQRFPVDHPFRPSADAALKASHQVAYLMGQLSGFARRPVLPEAAVEINQVISSHAKLLGRIAGPDRELTMRLTPQACEALAERDDLERALLNLVINAREATSDGGWILVETNLVELDHTVDPASTVRHTKPYVLLSVSDNGRGMTPAQRQRVFEPFFTTKQRGRGAGLGLALVYATLKHSGGDIRFHSEPGKGTTFKLYFPRAIDGRHRTSVQPAPTGRGGTVLVVDDEKAVRDMCATALRMLGYQVLAAAGPEEAIALSRSYPSAIDMLLTDVIMPGMSGPDLVRLLAAERSGMQIVYMSGYTAGSLERFELLAPAATFLSKPFTVRQLAAAIGNGSPGEQQGGVSD